MKGTVHQEEISILNIYAPNTGTSIYIKETVMALRTLLDTKTVIVGYWNTPPSPIDRSSRQKINKETPELLHTLDQIDMVDIYRVFYPPTRQYIFFSAAPGTFSKINGILGHKASLNKFKKIKNPLHHIRAQQNTTRPQQ
jgi:exonuclease III